MNTLDHLDLASADVTPETVFGNLVSVVKRLANPSGAGVRFEFQESGLPIIYPKVEFGGEVEEREVILSDDFMKTLDKAIASTDLRIWVLFDRLDEAFVGFPDFEVPALRALFRSYLDLQNMANLQLKLFVRRDLFRRIIKGGFVNLTHINAKKIDIIWDEEDLLNMLCQRIRKHPDAFEGVHIGDCSDDELFSLVFPPQVDIGKKKSTTFNWIMSRIRDGNDNKPPRNLIDLANKAREAQLRREAREGREIDPSVGPIIEPDSIKRGLRQLSDQRVQDTLMAEAGELADYVARFRDGKAEHNDESLGEVLGKPAEQREIVQGLIDLGFLERSGSSFKVPMIYRHGLKITQGKAFATDAAAPDDLEEGEDD